MAQVKILLHDTVNDHITSKERFLIREALKNYALQARTKFKGVSIDNRMNRHAGHPWTATIYTYSATTAGDKPRWHKRDVKIHVR